MRFGIVTIIAHQIQKTMTILIAAQVQAKMSILLNNKTFNSIPHHQKLEVSKSQPRKRTNRRTSSKNFWIETYLWRKEILIANYSRSDGRSNKETKYSNSRKKPKISSNSKSGGSLNCQTFTSPWALDIEHAIVKEISYSIATGQEQIDFC